MSENHSIYQCSRPLTYKKTATMQAGVVAASRRSDRGRLSLAVRVARSSRSYSACWLANARLLQRVIGRHREQRSIGFGTDDVLQPVDRFAAARIAVLGHHEHLQIRREPLLRHHLDRLEVADRAGRESWWSIGCRLRRRLRCSGCPRSSRGTSRHRHPLSEAAYFGVAAAVAEAAGLLARRCCRPLSAGVALRGHRPVLVGASRLPSSIRTWSAAFWIGSRYADRDRGSST